MQSSSSCNILLGSFFSIDALDLLMGSLLLHEEVSACSRAETRMLSSSSCNILSASFFLMDGLDLLMGCL